MISSLLLCLDWLTPFLPQTTQQVLRATMLIVLAKYWNNKFWDSYKLQHLLAGINGPEKEGGNSILTDHRLLSLYCLNFICCTCFRGLKKLQAKTAISSYCVKDTY